ncbi:NAD(P)-dependent oxidoreductase [Pseudescherichia vulneris]|uniref:NAD(P)-dependent oxidoreductase n=1 Tax=Pseudescherichia vulneris TaxID=566 RepID=UPI00227A8C27|nr:NAD(P)-dependent oxidoreductase [Pseudescherichia vulneris]WAH52772.1 NAD(P)-dependent oxidoreductase [Pseudescherichia vulneris]
MSFDPILLMGGSGAIGHQTARAIHAIYPDVPLLIGGRDLTRAQSAAAEMGRAQGVEIDLASADMGLGEQKVSAVVVLYKDHSLASLHFAQKRGVPHLSISSGIFEIAPEIASFMHAPTASAIVLGYEWLVGATTVPALHLAKSFSQVEEIRIGALVDEHDTGGPAVAADFEHLNHLLPAALTLRDGIWLWREGEDAKAVFSALDGTEINASGFSSIDVTGLATSTGARSVQFDLGQGVSSSRRKGGTLSTEIVLDISGLDHAGQALHTRHAVVHPGGAAPLTGMGIALLLERLIGLDGKPPVTPGLYFPWQILDTSRYLAQLAQEGGQVVELTSS